MEVMESECRALCWLRAMGDARSCSPVVGEPQVREGWVVELWCRSSWPRDMSS